MSVLTFRQATTADLPAIVALLRDDMLGAGREGEAEDPAYAQAFAAMEAQGGNRVLLACDGEEVVGCLQLILIPGLSLNGMLRAQIEGVRAAASRRGEGVGAALVDEALRRAHSQGAGLAQLTSNAARTEAHRFWEACGFDQTHLGYKMSLVDPA